MGKGRKKEEEQGVDLSVIGSTKKSGYYTILPKMLDTLLLEALAIEKQGKEVQYAIFFGSVVMHWKKFASL